MNQPQRSCGSLMLIVGLLLLSSGALLAADVNSSTPSVFRSLQKETNTVRMNDSYIVQEENQDLPLALRELLDLSFSAENSDPSERLLESKAKWVQTYHSGLAEAHSRPAAQTIDDKGNLYIAGYALNDMESLNSDYLVLKYDAGGTLLWSAKFDNKGKIDQPSGICTDRSGNVFVTGWSYVRGGASEWSTIKLDAHGNLVWQKHFQDQNMTGFAMATAIALDSNENVYVAGYSSRPPKGHGFILIKYTNDGTEVWQRIESVGEYATAMSIDRNDNILIAGSMTDFLVSKYSVDGELIWTTKSFETRVATLRDMTLDNDGNVYLTGNAGNDFATCKISSDGIEHWSATWSSEGDLMDTACNITVDTDGNAYVAGTSTEDSRYHLYNKISVVKYSASGDQVWSTAYQDPVSYSHQNSSLVCTEKGELYLGCTNYYFESDCDYALVQFDLDGNEQWARKYNSPGNAADFLVGLHVNSDQNLILTGYADQYNKYTVSLTEDGKVRVSGYTKDFGKLSHIMTIKTTETGDQQWTANYSEQANSYDEPHDILADRWGNVLVTGSSKTVDTGTDFVTLKYDSTGKELTLNRFNSEANKNDVAKLIKTDRIGRYTVCGEVRNQDEKIDIVAIHYDLKGREQWRAVYSNPDADKVSILDFTVNSEGGVFLGIRETTGDNQRMVLANYGQNGNQEWAKQLDGKTLVDLNTFIVNEMDRTITMAGTALNDKGGRSVALVKMDQQGWILWKKSYDFEYSFATADCETDYKGNFILTGNQYSTTTEHGYSRLIKCSPNGELIWSHYYQPPDHRAYKAKDLEIDQEGNILMTGTLYAFNRPYRVYTTKFNDAGEELWNQTYTPPSSKGGGSPVVAGLVTDSRGYTFVSGHAVPYQNQPEEYYCLLYDKSGSLVWMDSIYGMTSAGITLDEQDNVYVAGALRTGKYTSGYATLQYKAETTTAVEQGKVAAVPEHFNLEQNYPNPFNPSTAISFQLPEKENVQLSIYNMAGQLVETLVNEERQPGVHTVQWIANSQSSGVYFCTIKTGSFSKTIKMLLIR